MNDEIGIYKITCIPTQMVYVGQSINIAVRWKQHLNELRNNKHHNTNMQEDFLKYGEVNFNFEILTLCESEILNMLEKYYVDKNEKLNRSYNITSGGGGRFKSPIELTPDEYRIIQDFKQNEKLDFSRINPYLSLIKICRDNELTDLIYLNNLIDKSKKLNGIKYIKSGTMLVESDVLEMLSMATYYIKRYIRSILDEKFKCIEDIIKFKPLYKESNLDKNHLLLECEVIKTGEKFTKNVYF